MTNLLQALFLITDMALQVGIMMTQYQMLVARAQSEGRDISDAELDELRTERKAAIERFFE